MSHVLGASEAEPHDTNDWELDGSPGSHGTDENPCEKMLSGWLA
jgi:hypothetical protein